MNTIRLYLTYGVFLLLNNSFGHAQQSALGIFDAQSDIGNPPKKGLGTYSAQNQSYTLTSSGYDRASDYEGFHYVYKKMKGDFIVYARGTFEQHLRGDAQHNMGWMIRQSLDKQSAYIRIAKQGGGLISYQFRRMFGTATEEIPVDIKEGADIIQLERRGHVFTMRVAKFGEPFVTKEISNIQLSDEVYVGLFVHSHNPEIAATGLFQDVRITVPYPEGDGKSVSMTLGSDLELLDIATGKREIIYRVPYSIQAPNWTLDNKSLIFNDSKGTMYTFDLKTRQAHPLHTGEVKHNNNDHVLSFDGKMLGLSSSVRSLGGSIIYTVPVTGGIPKQITPKGPSYLHGWSPNGDTLVFCGERNGEFDVYKIPANGGQEIRLTTTKGLDDGPEYSPDGKYIYFNSVRSGLMQIWRMRPDGSNQEQVTNDEFNNWFAHVSPDGKWLVFLSFLKEQVDPSDHPPYKQVYIRLMPTSGGKPKVLAYFYGGQGSINTPSWSPDSKKIAFISNSGNR